MKCADKVTYETRREAWEFARTVRTAHKRARMYVYECSVCHKYHLTHIRPERFHSRHLCRRYDYNKYTQL